jgi:hypothetical protein
MIPPTPADMTRNAEADLKYLRNLYPHAYGVLGGWVESWMRRAVAAEKVAQRFRYVLSAWREDDNPYGQLAIDTAAKWKERYGLSDEVAPGIASDFAATCLTIARAKETA